MNIVSRLVERYGVKKVSGGIAFYGFPDPCRLSDIGAEELRRLGISRRKAGYIKAFSEEVCRGYDIEGVKSLDPSEAVRELTRFKGIGPWTAKLSIMASTGYMGLELFEDKAVEKGFSLLRITSDKLQAILRDLGDYVGLINYLAAIDYELSRKHS